MAKEVKLPELGEEVEKATVSFWYHEEGERVEKEEDLVEMVTDKATFNVPSPAFGTLSQIKAEEGAIVKAGEVLAIIEEDE